MKPELKRAVAKTKIKASDWNWNFDQLIIYIENGIADNALNNYEADRTYKKGDWVKTTVDGKQEIYESIVDGNKGQSLTNPTYWKKVNLGSAFSLFDIKIADHILEGDEAKGWALQGTYVTGALYPDFYAKCIEEYNSATSTEMVNNATIKVHTNGHKFYDISNKSKIDSYYNTNGIADYYGIDTENEQIFLPRRKSIKNYNLTGSSQVSISGTYTAPSDGTIYISGIVNNLTGTITLNGSKIMEYGDDATGATVNAHTIVVKKGDVVVIPYGTAYFRALTLKKEYEVQNIYYCVGNTVVNNSEIDAGALVATMENKANTNLDNLSSDGKSLTSCWAMPSANSTKLTIGASGSTYTMPANGYLVAFAKSTGSTGTAFVWLGWGKMFTKCTQYYDASNKEATLACFIPVKKGAVVTYNYTLMSTVDEHRLEFVYAQGEI